MTVRIRYKGDDTREVVFPDDETSHFTARDYPDGRIEVTLTRSGSSDRGVVVAEFTLREIELIDNGWPADE